MVANETLQLLREVPLFRRLSRAQQATLARQAREEWFAPGEDVVTAGNPGGRVYVVLAGRAREHARGRPGRTLARGAFFGDVSLLDGEPHPVTVRAETIVKAVSLSSLSFVGLLEENWGVAREVIAELCRHVRSLEAALTG